MAENSPTPPMISPARFLTVSQRVAGALLLINGTGLLLIRIVRIWYLQWQVGYLGTVFFLLGLGLTFLSFQEGSRRTAKIADRIGLFGLPATAVVLFSILSPIEECSGQIGELPLQVLIGILTSSFPANLLYLAVWVPAQIMACSMISVARLNSRDRLPDLSVSASLAILAGQALLLGTLVKIGVNSMKRSADYFPLLILAPLAFCLTALGIPFGACSPRVTSFRLALLRSVAWGFPIHALIVYLGRNWPPNKSAVGFCTLFLVSWTVYGAFVLLAAAELYRKYREEFEESDTDESPPADESS